MTTDELAATATAGRPRQGHPGRRRAAARSPSASSRSRWSRPPSTAAPTGSCCSPPRAAEHISGVILYDETRPAGGRRDPLAEVLSRQGIICGIKVDKGTTGLAGFEGEKITEGLDGLAGRLAAYRDLGARFTKWRAVITIGEHIPTSAASGQRRGPGRFAALPGGRAGADRRARGADGRRPHHRALRPGDPRHPGRGVRRPAPPPGPPRRHAAQAEHGRLRQRLGHPGRRRRSPPGLLDHVPASVPGIVFLSGGQSDEAATAHLNAMNRLGGAPWQLSFSYGRALRRRPSRPGRATRPTRRRPRPSTTGPG